ncbi:MAG: nucleotidyltransferase domain-containing protein [Planctomycetota bacterium]|jgi:predicted nucleotidyltransferase|nr:nucleotidyltransferase domain-containing protein [Planctomycetota bacterium]MDP7129289.1 nucleotidyltransferase domain-containing protein [Planctomycetota bacterium]MDP7251338.1 nucleotidyltransferase domain-containing protein [Planctomycetota bacterium]
MLTTSGPLGSLVSQIVELVHPERIFVFGSAAKGVSGPDSDIDLLVVTETARKNSCSSAQMPEGTHRRHTAQRLYREIRGAGVPFDLTVTTAGSLEKHRDNIGLIYRQALIEGKEVYAA